MVVLRRLADAIADGDPIRAVIKATAINNDGASKAGYLAPSVTGQAEAIVEAQTLAGVTADTLQYVECHGTGTKHRRPDRDRGAYPRIQTFHGQERILPCRIGEVEYRASRYCCRCCKSDQDDAGARARRDPADTRLSKSQTRRIRFCGEPVPRL